MGTGLRISWEGRNRTEFPGSQRRAQVANRGLEGLSRPFEPMGFRAGDLGIGRAPLALSGPGLGSGAIEGERLGTGRALALERQAATAPAPGSTRRNRGRLLFLSALSVARGV